MLRRNIAVNCIRLEQLCDACSGGSVCSNLCLGSSFGNIFRFRALRVSKSLLRLGITQQLEKHQSRLPVTRIVIRSLSSRARRSRDVDGDARGDARGESCGCKLGRPMFPGIECDRCSKRSRPRSSYPRSSNRCSTRAPRTGDAPGRSRVACRSRSPDDARIRRSGSSCRVSRVDR